MAKLFVIAGHGAGDPGACSDGYNEADLVRQLATRLKNRGGSEVQVGDTSVNWYASNYIGAGKCPAGVPVIELHMDSAVESARGGHVIIKEGFSADSYDNALASFIGSMFPGRSKTLVGRSDLANPNRAAAMGVNYRLLECCFISNDEDRTKFINEMDAVADGILAAFGIKSNGASTPSQPSTSKPSTSTGSSSSTSNSSGEYTGTGFGGTYRCNATSLNVRDKPSLSGTVVASYSNGETVVLDDWYKIADGYVWGRYTAYSGAIRYIAVGPHTGKPESNDYLIKVSGGSSSAAPAKKSVDEIAREIINGTCSDSRWSTWGTGQTRKDRLAAAGYDATAVQNRVNQLL